MTVRAKFKCVTVLKTESGETIELTAVTKHREGNETWAKYTPSGDIKMSVTNPSCFGFYVPGKEYFLDITLAEPEMSLSQSLAACPDA